MTTTERAKGRRELADGNEEKETKMNERNAMDKYERFLRVAEENEPNNGFVKSLRGYYERMGELTGPQYRALRKIAFRHQTMI